MLIEFLDVVSVRDIDVSINYIKSTCGTMCVVLMKNHFSSDMIYLIFIGAKFTINTKAYTSTYKDTDIEELVIEIRSSLYACHSSVRQCF